MQSSPRPCSHLTSRIPSTASASNRVPAWQVNFIAMVERWTADQLMKCLQPELSQYPAQTQQAFENAQITGAMFLEGTTAYFLSIGLQKGLSYHLADVVLRIKGAAPLVPNQISNPGKRVHSPEEKEHSIGHKVARLREQDMVGPPAAKLIEDNEDQTMKKFRSQIAQVSPHVHMYCDPSVKQLLPFPFPYIIPKGFKLDGNGCFEFYGRAKFRELYDVACSMDTHINPRFYFHGTLGAGKSHLLAALVCLLMHLQKRVVFVPDCYELLAEPGAYLEAALLHGFDSHLLLGALIRDIALRGAEDTKLADLKEFCWKAGKCGEHTLFIIDQANALDDEEPGVERIDNDQKKLARSLLDSIVTYHTKIASYTANYKLASTDIFRQTGEGRVCLHHGLNDVEMKAWWALNATILAQRFGLSAQFGEDEKRCLEGLTGRMPIFLQGLLNITPEPAIRESESYNSGEPAVATSPDMGGIPQRLTKLYDALVQSEEIQLLIKHITEFWDNHANRLSDDRMNHYTDAVLACATGGMVETEGSRLLDWRYFYVDNKGRGHCTSEFARLVAKGLLKTVVNIHDFRDTAWETRTQLSGKNPSILGFNVEYLVLKHIVVNGCLIAGAEFDTTQTHEVFRKEMPTELPTDFAGAKVYLPASFNFRAGDGILVYRDAKKEKGVVVGIQVTIAGSHSDSEFKFLSNWKSWKVHLGCKETEFRFLWIVENLANYPRDELVREATRQTRSGTSIVTPSFKRLVASVQDVSPVTGRCLRKARQLAIA
ncbi:hypothetical protein FN846DRAFT_992273 [Sphaerosporella brunnea]|uniref:Uncharacterized protein n=1 Tax=Sphaerosporella brunnea TaxID=1250544 RepID=A0A5J5ENW2_9PEZI|nr:hypothetical protein FN846DRAFT_992273 [Sphaerosporella brunnea]